MMKRILAALALAGGAATAHAETLDLNLNSDTLRADLSGPLSAVFPRFGGSYGIGLLTGEDEGVDYRQIHVGLLATGDAGARDANVTAGLGGRVVVVDVESIGGGALTLGGQVEARIPDFNRIGLIAYVYGAPKASSFGDLEGHLEYAIAVDYQVLRQASLYVGYRQLKLDVEDAGTGTVDNGWHGGLRLNF